MWFHYKLHDVKSENILQFLSDSVKISQLKPSIDISPDYIQWSENQRAHFTSLTNDATSSKSVYSIQKLSNSLEQSSTLNGNMKQSTNNKESRQAAYLKINKSTTDLDIRFPVFRNNESDELNFTASNVVYSGPTSVILAILTAIVSFITIVGNILVLMSFFVERALRTASNYFLASLAVTDVLIGLFSMNFYTLYLLLGRWPLGRLSCDLWLSLDYTACLTSQYTVLIITIDRFCSVHIPAKYRNWRTDRKVLILVAVTWIIPSSVFFTTIMGWPYFQTNVSPRPYYECYAEFANDPVFNTVFTVCYFWVTLCVMLGLYVGIYRVAADLQRRSDEKRNRVSGLIASSTQNNQGTKGSQMNNQTNSTQNMSQKGTNMQNYPNNSSMGCLGDSSGFDSDEGKPNPVKHNTPAKINKAVERRKPLAQNNMQNANQIKPEPQNQKTFVSLPKIEARCDISPSILENILTNPVKAKTLDSSKPISDPFNDKQENEIGYLFPTSVMTNKNPGLMISSPVLTDEDSGLEVNYCHTIIPQKIQEPPISECYDFLNTEEVSVKVTKQNQSNNEKSYSKGEESKEKTVDPNYQNRVMEQFRQRLAALNNQNVVSRGSNYTKHNDHPSNIGLSKSKQVNNHSRLTLNTLNCSESTSSKGTENNINNTFNNHDIHAVNYRTHQKPQFSNSNIDGSNSTETDTNLQSPLYANNSSPIWKSRPMCCDGMSVHLAQ
ncbi:unnamed protein product [Heterobilharzia americana]|nr:unnamed protein product [Heterobilharzia americana]